MGDSNRSVEILLDRSRAREELPSGRAGEATLAPFFRANPFAPAWRRTKQSRPRRETRLTEVSYWYKSDPILSLMKMFQDRIANGDAHAHEPSFLADFGRHLQLHSKGVVLKGPVVSRDKNKEPTWTPPKDTSTELVQRTWFRASLPSSSPALTCSPGPVTCSFLRFSTRTEVMDWKREYSLHGLSNAQLLGSGKRLHRIDPKKPYTAGFWISVDSNDSLTAWRVRHLPNSAEKRSSMEEYRKRGPERHVWGMVIVGKVVSTVPPEGRIHAYMHPTLTGPAVSLSHPFISSSLRTV